MKRYNLDNDCINYAVDKGINILHKMGKNGSFVNVTDCIIAEQDNMMMGDSLEKLNEQMLKQIKNAGPFDVMVILKEVDNEKI